jgi:hypothetical protein
MKGTKITRNEIDAVFASLTGLPVSRVWRGYGTAVFFEIGALQPHTTRKGKDSPRGEISLMIEWSWRVEKARSIWFGAFSTQKKIDARLSQLVGHTIEVATLEGRLPEISLELSDELWFRSFMCEQGTQEWVIFSSDYAYYARGRSFYKEPRREANKS